MADTACKCCQRFLVCRIEDQWGCWYCDPTNATKWKCGKQHANKVASSSEVKVAPNKTSENNTWVGSGSDTRLTKSGADGTVLQYFHGTYVFEDTAKVLSVIELDEKIPTTEVILDRTIFHPQGGGQPSDIGVITSMDGQAVFAVSGVQMKDRKTVIHTGKFQSSTKFTVGSTVRLSIDRKTREMSAKIHSAGHLLDIAMEKAGFTFVPTKGYHFPDGPYVEYEGDIPAEEKENAMKSIQSALDTLLATPGGIPLTSQIVPYGDIASLCGSTPSYMPVGQPARVVAFRGALGCPCGGTHVENSQQIGSCRVTKIVKRKNILRVCYEVV